MSDTEIKILKTRLDYVEKEIVKTDEQLEKRLATMNEFRQALRDANITFITRTEYDAKHVLLNEKIELLQKMVWIGVGIVLVLELILKFVK